jgi:hypothetical protein
MRRLFSQLLLFVGLTLLFSGCGSDSGGGSGFSSGGSSSHSTSPINTISQISDNSAGENNSNGGNDRVTTKMKDVIFVDTFCSGLSYVALNVNNEIVYEGKTSETGSASVPEETKFIQFKIGNLVLGKVESSQVVTLNELFKHSNFDDKRVLFAARLLLSIDDDHIPDNGIQISAETSNSIATFQGIEDENGNILNITNLNVDTETATKILEALLEHIGMDSQYVVTEAEARIHLEDSANELEEGVYSVVIKPSDHNESCPQGGVARVHVVDFDKTDNNYTPSVYVDYFCDTTTNFDEKTHFELSKGNEKCPNGGIKIHHKIYNEGLQNPDDKNLVTEYDEYRCNGAEAYNYNTFIFYSKTNADNECQHRIEKTIQTKKANNISVINDAKEYICVDDDKYSDIKIVDLLGSSEVCVGGGVRIDFINGDEVEKSSYLCNQATERGYTEGEHTIVAVEASVENCPNGGTEFKHSVDADNNGELDTFYSEIKCNNSNSETRQTQGDVKIITTKVLLTKDMEDSSKCPYGGYRLEKKMMQGDKIISEYNDYNCTDTTNLMRDEVTPVILNAKDYKSEKNEWCPNGGFKYEHKVYFNNVLNHSYFDINCSPTSTSEQNETIELEIGNQTCPYGGKIVVHKVIFNGDAGHPSNYEYNTTLCNKFDYNATIQQITEVDRYTNGGVTCVVKLHQRYFQGVHVPSLDYNTTECQGTDWSSTSDKKDEKIIPFGDKRCPDGGREITHQRIDENGNVIDDWTYTVVICNGLQYDETHEINKTTILPVGNSKCPYGGKEILHQRFTNDTNTHVERWDYVSVHCNGFNYEETQEKNITVKQFVAGDGNTICPDGGKIILHQRFIDGVHIDYFDYNTTHCEGIDYNQTKDVPQVVVYDPDVCPYGGKIILHQRFLVDKDGNPTSTHIAKWDYNSTVCDGVDYNKTLDKLTEETLEIGNSICPDGGKVVKHQRYIDKNGNGKIDDADKHVPYWDYSETICSGLDYNQTVEEQIVTVFGYGERTECPDGGKFIEHRRYVDSDNDGKFTKNVDTIRVEKWDYNTTHCQGLDYKDAQDKPVVHILPFGDLTCPDGGKIIEHKFYANINGVESHIEKWDYNSTHCVGLDYNQTLEFNTSVEADLSVCPDGGKVISHSRYVDKNGNGNYDAGIDVNVSKWFFTTTHCVGLDYNQTLEHNITEIIEFNSPICPDGGLKITHIRYIDENGNNEYNEGIDKHIVKWDYETVHCHGLDYNQTLEHNETQVLYVDDPVCPDGGLRITHIRYIDNNGNGQYEEDKDTHVAKWDYTTVHCHGLDYNDTLEYNDTKHLEIGDKICPGGGEITKHIRYVDNNGNGQFDSDDKIIDRWTYSTTTCKGLDYNETLEHNITQVLKFGNSICPDGGKIITHIRYVDNNGNGQYDEDVDAHIDYWDYTTTHCVGLEYNETVEVNVTDAASKKDCPYGGVVITHQRWTVNDNGSLLDHVTKWDYTTVHCGGGDQLDNIHEIILPRGDATCPDGGKIVEHNVTNNGVSIAKYTTVHCGREGSSINTGLNTHLTLAGYVTDVNWSPIANAKVTVTIDDQTFEVVTGVNGVYQVYNAKLGAEVVVEAEGYQTKKGILQDEHGVLDFRLIADNLSHVNDLELIFFNIDREMGADKALEYADVKGWRLLTFDELQALYYSPRRDEFTKDEYFSSSNEIGPDGKIVGDKWGYTLWTLRFSDGQKWPFWYSFRKHQVFVDDPDKEPIKSREFIDLNQSANWYSANSVCSGMGKRLPTVQEMKTIYFNSGHPIGIADKNIIGGEYWTLNMTIEDQNDSGEYRYAKFFRVVGPQEDYHIENNADPLLTKKILCVTPDANETVKVKGTVRGYEAVKLSDIKITFKLIPTGKETENQTPVEFNLTTEDNGTYSIVVPSGRYLVTFDPEEYNKIVPDSNYTVKEITVDLRGDSTVNVTLNGPTKSDTDYKVACAYEECKTISYNVKSSYNVDNKTWSYSITKTKTGEVDLDYFTLRLSPLCMQQITNLEGGSVIALNDKGIIDGIKSDGDTISFTVNSTADYSSDISNPLTITTVDGFKTSVNIATPVCYFLDENHSVTGTVEDENGDPVPGATVKAEVTDSITDEVETYEFTTDNLGIFSDQVKIKFKNETSQGIFTASKEGYISSEPETVQLTRDNLNQIGTLVLTPKDVNVTGIVTSVNGEPISDAVVVIFDENHNEIFNTVTDSEGKFLYETKVGQKLSIEVSKDLYQNSSISLTTVSMSVNKFNFKLEEKEQFVRIYLNIVNSEDNSLISGSTFVLKDLNGLPIAINGAGRNGQFTIYLNKKPGEELKANLEASAFGYESKTQEIVIGDTEQNITVELEGLAPTLKIYAIGNNPFKKINGASVNIYADSQEDAIYSDVTDSNGLAVFESIPAGDYKVSVSYPGYNEFTQEISLKNGDTRYIYANINPTE